MAVRVSTLMIPTSLLHRIIGADDYSLYNHKATCDENDDSMQKRGFYIYTYQVNWPFLWGLQTTISKYRLTMSSLSMLRSEGPNDAKGIITLIQGERRIILISVFIAFSQFQYGFDSAAVSGFQSMPGFLAVFGYVDVSTTTPWKDEKLD